MGALSELGTSSALDLAQRLGACCQRRTLHGAFSSQVERVAPCCRTIACARCRRSAQRRWHDAAAEVFHGISGRDCSFITINLSRAASLDDVQAVMSRFRVALRNLRDRQARLDSAWSGLIVRGVIEVDWIEALDAIPNLFRQRRQMLADLPSEGVGASDVWLPHAHLSIAHPGVSREELRSVLTSMWPGRFRVHVKSFHDVHADAGTNAANCVSYASKLLCQSRVGEIRTPWPMQVQAKLFSWLHAARRGLDFLRVRLGARRGAYNVRWVEK